MLALKDLMAALGSANLDCRQDGAGARCVAPRFLLLNTAIAGIEEADALLIVGARTRPAVAVQREGVEVIPERDHVPLHQLADLRVVDGHVSDERAPLIVDPPNWEESDDELRSGARSFLPRIDSAPYRPPSIDSIIDVEWS